MLILHSRFEYIHYIINTKYTIVKPNENYMRSNSLAAVINLAVCTLSNCRWKIVEPSNWIVINVISCVNLLSCTYDLRKLSSNSVYGSETMTECWEKQSNVNTVNGSVFKTAFRNT